MQELHFGIGQHDRLSLLHLGLLHTSDVKEPFAKHKKGVLEDLQLVDLLAVAGKMANS